MKKIEEIKLMEVDALAEMTEHVETVMNDIDVYKEYLSNRYYSLKRSEIPLDTDFIASAYVNKITDIILNYYLNRVLLTGITFDVSQENPEEKKGDVVAFADTVYASDFTKKINLNRLVVSGNGNFVIWYTTTGSSAITEGQAREIADELENLTDRDYWPFPVYADLLFSE